MSNLMLGPQNNSSERAYYDFILPKLWKFQRSKTYSRFFNQKKRLGAVQVMFWKSRDNKAANPLDKLNEILSNGLFNYSPKNIKTYSRGNKKYAEVTCVDLNEAFCRIWVIAQKDKIIFAIYSCALKFKGHETEAVEKLVNRTTFQGERLAFKQSLIHNMLV